MKHSYHHYLWKQMRLLVVEHEFDFSLVAEDITKILIQLQERGMDQTECQEMWTEIHLVRRRAEVQKSVIDELIEQLPAERVARDFLTQEEGGFNVLRQGVRNEGWREKEQTFLKQLEEMESVKQSDLLYRYRADIDPQGRIVVQQKILDKDELERIADQARMMSIDEEEVESAEDDQSQSKAQQQQPEKVQQNAIIKQGSSSGEESEEESEDESSFFEMQRSMIKRN